MFFSLGIMLVLQLILAIFSLYYFTRVTSRDPGSLKTAFGLLIPAYALFIYTSRVMKKLRISSLFEWFMKPKTEIRVLTVLIIFLAALLVWDRFEILELRDNLASCEADRDHSETIIKSLSATNQKLIMDANHDLIDGINCFNRKPSLINDWKYKY